MSNSRPTLVFKYGGNAMLNEQLQKEVLQNLCALKEKGYHIVLVHGGGPFIKESLKMAKIESEFIGGQRKTTPEALKHVEMALKGNVNGKLVGLINQMGHTAVGLSGKDGKMVTAVKRYHEEVIDGKTKRYDLGQVGNVKKVDTRLLKLLLDNDYIPVMTCLAQDKKGDSYNINGDVFAGNIAGALQAKAFVVLTDIDGLRRDIDDPDSLISEVTPEDIHALIKEGVIQGGMIPKMESCLEALQKGAERAQIINGTLPKQILDLTANKKIGTTITES
jgi:acetylglutamate kinase